jgi:hypothetical protein
MAEVVTRGMPRNLRYAAGDATKISPWEDGILK